MFKFFAIPLALLAAACTASSDTYSFDHPEYDYKTVTVTFVDYDSKADFKREAKKLGLETETNDVQSFAKLNGSNCQIHMIKPTVRYAPEWLGHELYHCRYGRFHD